MYEFKSPIYDTMMENSETWYVYFDTGAAMLVADCQLLDC
jgi:hypothetical protein